MHITIKSGLNSLSRNILVLHLFIIHIMKLCSLICILLVCTCAVKRKKKMACIVHQLFLFHFLFCSSLRLALLLLYSLLSHQFAFEPCTFWFVLLLFHGIPVMLMNIFLYQLPVVPDSEIGVITAFIFAHTYLPFLREFSIL